MILNFVTCSGTNEFTDIKDLVALMREFPLGEVAVQVSEKQSPAGGARIEWVRQLVAYTNEHNLSICAALHVNRTWVENLCRGIVVPELQEMLQLRDIYGLPFFRRIQLNFKLGRDDVSENCGGTLMALQQRIKRRFILSYNESNAKLIKLLYLKGLRFDCLFDSSFGAGIAPNTRQAPVFADILQGYAGGITPDNVCAELDKIYSVVETSPAIGNIYVDAQKGLEDEQTHLSLDKCQQYLANATAWYHSHRWHAEL